MMMSQICLRSSPFLTLSSKAALPQTHATARQMGFMPLNSFIHNSCRMREGIEKELYHFRRPQSFAIARFSTQESSSFFSPINWWKERQEKKEAEKYKTRIAEMAEKEKWTLAEMKKELDEAEQSWLSKLGGDRVSKELAVAKQMHKSVSGIASIVGLDASDDELDGLSKKDKLKAAVAGETTVEDINLLIQQFQSMSLMHRIVRKRKVEGKPIPQTPDALQAIMQVEGPKLLSKTQKARIMDAQAKKMKKVLRKR
jgi:hypothetical protein